MPKPGTITLLFTDVAGSTETLARLGDHAAEDLRRRHFAILRGALDGHHGREIKNLGDGLMIAFPSAIAAVSAATEMQRQVAAHNRAHTENQLAVRIGINTGEAFSDRDDYFGTTVVVAKRLCDRAQGGQILVSELVYQLIGQRAGHTLREVGSLSLKGLADPVPAAEVEWSAALPGAEISASDGTPIAETGDPVGDRPPVGGSTVELPAVMASMTAGRLSGRETELAELRAELDEAKAGRRRLVLLAGEPGIGKTRLACEISRLAHSEGATALYGRSDEGGVIPFQPFVEALGHYVDSCPLAALRAQPADSLAALSRLLPQIQRRLPDLPPASYGEGDGETERHRMFAAIVSLLSSMARGMPVVLMLDDLHWADTATLLVLKHILRDGDDCALLIVGTYRDVEVGRTHPLAAALHDLHRERIVPRKIDVRGLSRAEVHDLITGWAGQAPPSGLTEAVWVETEGHPFFVEEVLRHLLETGAINEIGGRLSTSESLARVGIPDTVRSVIERRVLRLTETTQTTLAMAAVVGREFTADLLEQVCDEEPHAVLDSLEESVASRLVVEAPGTLGGYRFSHALVRETLYDGLSDIRRARLHARVGEALESDTAKGTLRRLPDLAHHFFEAAVGTDVFDKAIRYAAEAAELAASQLAYEEAATHLERALHGLALRGGDEALQCDLLLNLGENLWNAGEYGRAREAFGRAAAIAERLELPEYLARAALGSGGRMGLPLEGGVIDKQLVHTLERALELLGDSHPALRAEVMGRLGSALLFSPSRDHGEALANSALELARAIGDEALLAKTHSDTWLARWRFGNLESRLVASEEFLRLSEQVGNTALVLEARMWQAATLFEHGDVAAGEVVLERGRLLVDELRQAYYTWFFTVFESGRAIMRGDLDTGERLMWQALETGQTSDNPCAAELFAPQVLMLRILQGRAAEIHAGSAAMTEHFAAIPAFRSGLAVIYAELGLTVEARREFERLAVNDFGDVSDDIFRLSTIYLAADVCLFLGDRRRAEPLYALLAPCSTRYVVLGSICAPVGACDRVVGNLASLLGRHDEALERLTRAAAIEESLGAKPALARTRCDMAQALLAQDASNAHQAARTHAQAALAIAEEYGITGVGRRAAALLDGLQNTDPEINGKLGLGDRATAMRNDVRAAISTRGRAGLARALADASDDELERRFGSPLAMRALFAGMAKGFQPRMAYGFEGEIQFELLPGQLSRDESAPQGSQWWTVQIRGSRAVARHRTARDPALSMRTAVADFVRLMAGLSNPVTLWIDHRVEVQGDVTLAIRLVEMFGGVAPLDVPAQGQLL